MATCFGSNFESFCKRPDDAAQLEPEHVAMNETDKN